VDKTADGEQANRSLVIGADDKATNVETFYVSVALASKMSN
jgi:hypothetical protein